MAPKDPLTSSFGTFVFVFDFRLLSTPVTAFYITFNSMYIRGSRSVPYGNFFITTTLNRREQLSFSFPELRYGLLHKKLPTFDELKEME